MDIRTVGVVGCGQMGGGIAQVAAAAGYSVVVMDASPELLEKGLGRIRTQLDRFIERVNRFLRFVEIEIAAA